MSHVESLIDHTDSFDYFVAAENIERKKLKVREFRSETNTNDFDSQSHPGPALPGGDARDAETGVCPRCVEHGNGRGDGQG